jgi:DNA-binding LacI/PurR family transcriptional regulator
VIDLSQVTPDEFLRSLVVRNVPVVAVGREPKTYSMNAVVMDRALGLSKVARDLLLGGHSRFLAVEERGSTIVSDVLRSTRDAIRVRDQHRFVPPE